MKKRNSLASFLLTVALLFTNGNALAGGSTVAPAFARFSLSNSKQIDETSVFVKNNNEVAVTYTTTVVDVDTETGSLTPLETTSKLTSQLFSVNTTKFILQPEQSINIRVLAKNSDDIPPGGRYAALVLRQFVDAEQSKRLPIQSAISIGLFLVKEDGAIRQVQLKQNSTKKIWFTAPRAEKLTLQNSGNVDIVVSGFVSIQQGTKTFSKSAINTEARPLYPQKSADFTVPYTNVKMQAPGRYKKVIAYRYIGDENLTVQSSDVWYFPFWSIGLTVALVAVCLWLFTHQKAKNNLTKSAEKIPKKSV